MNATFPRGETDSLVAATYRRLLFGTTQLATGATNGNTYCFIGNGSSLTFPGIGAGNQASFPIIYLVATELSVSGLTTKLNLRLTVATGTTAPARTITAGLYPLTSAASAWVPGTVVPNSQAANPSPNASTVTGIASGDFTLPSDGPFALGVIVSGAISGGVTVAASLSYRNV